MHLATGLIIAALAGRVKQNRLLQGMPMLKTGPLQVAHVLPGRIRFMVPALREKDSALLDGLEQLSEVHGIEHVSFSTISGSVLVRFNQEIIDPPLLFGVLVRLLGLSEELEQRVTSSVVEELREVGASLNRLVYDESRGLLDLQTLVIGALLYVGGKKLLQERWAAVPNGLTLIWWALNLLYRGKGGA